MVWQKKELSKRELKMLDIIKNQKDHCDEQIKRFKKEKDYDSAKEWLVRSLECEHILKTIKSELRLSDEEVS